MFKTFALAAVVAVVAVAPASAAEIRVKLAGKSDAQIQAEVADAARSVCRKQAASETVFLGAYTRCVKGTVKATQAKLAENAA